MTEPRNLHLYVVPPGCGGSFAVRRHGGYVLVEPLSNASKWLKPAFPKTQNGRGTTSSSSLDIFPEIAEAIIEAGFLFDVDGGPIGVLH